MFLLKYLYLTIYKKFHLLTKIIIILSLYSMQVQLFKDHMSYLKIINFNQEELIYIQKNKIKTFLTTNIYISQLKL